MSASGCGGDTMKPGRVVADLLAPGPADGPRGACSRHVGDPSGRLPNPRQHA